ncbi:hypothetical protein ACIQU6_32180 [Streptomyces sp. NPDC090442]|uniref:hypothetical protein n=1 Tax=Streptomyces sp. NPDC090442 TaxID=3365962 RepID=UPI0037F403C8
MAEIDTLLGRILPAVEAAAGAYGVGMLARAESEATRATVRSEQRPLAPTLHRGTDAHSVSASATGNAGIIAIDDGATHGLYR